MMSAYHVRHRIVEAVVALSQGQEVGEPRREHQLVHARIRETPVYGLNVDAVDALSLRPPKHERWTRCCSPEELTREATLVFFGMLILDMMFFLASTAAKSHFG